MSGETDEASETIAYDDFAKVDVRVGRVVAVEDFPRARKPAYKLQIDFGPEVGVKWSSVQAKSDYTKDELLGRLVVCVVNLSPRNIAGFQSEVLTLGVPAEDGGLALLVPSRPAAPGGRMY
ncbi:MAG TPA: tRNA-binding protein [Ktedonobacterales bacterium]|nr:tRNA-binding protein [Ktedonobacterales bacterium]